MDAVLVVDTARASLIPMMVAPSSWKFTPVLPLIVNAPALVVHDDAPAAVIVMGLPASVAQVVPSCVNVTS